VVLLQELKLAFYGDELLYILPLDCSLLGSVEGESHGE
jgi:hypothetical protein